MARDIRTKTRLVYPEADNKTLETLMRQYFVSCLADKEQRLSVSKSHPRTLTQVMAYAKEYESIMKTEDRRTQDEAVEQEPQLREKNRGTVCGQKRNPKKDQWELANRRRFLSRDSKW